MTLSKEKMAKILESIKNPDGSMSPELLLKQLKDKTDNEDESFDADDFLKLLKQMRSGNRTLVPTYWEYVIFFVVFAVIILIFAFFGYKLYRSLTEKQRRREEKQRAKLAKKKK